jgi:hypothetical protein
MVIYAPGVGAPTTLRLPCSGCVNYRRGGSRSLPQLQLRATNTGGRSRASSPKLPAPSVLSHEQGHSSLSFFRCHGGKPPGVAFLVIKLRNPYPNIPEGMFSKVSYAGLASQDPRTRGPPRSSSRRCLNCAIAQNFTSVGSERSAPGRSGRERQLSPRLPYLLNVHPTGRFAPRGGVGFAVRSSRSLHRSGTSSAPASRIGRGTTPSETALLCLMAR